MGFSGKNRCDECSGELRIACDSAMVDIGDAIHQGMIGFTSERDLELTNRYVTKKAGALIVQGCQFTPEEIRNVANGCDIEG